MLSGVIGPTHFRNKLKKGARNILEAFWLFGLITNIS
jgi:hypothetical protein